MDRRKDGRGRGRGSKKVKKKTHATKPSGNSILVLRGKFLRDLSLLCEKNNSNLWFDNL